jgi:hypothetical protein
MKGMIWIEPQNGQSFMQGIFLLADRRALGHPVIWMRRLASRRPTDRYMRMIKNDELDR